MIYNKENAIFFWYGSTKGKIGYECLSQWFEREFKDCDGIAYTSVEQYVAANKAKMFRDEDSYTKIMKENDPKVIRELSKFIKNYKQYIWDKNKFALAVAGNYYKFSQNNDLWEILKNTGTKMLANASPWDKIWGIGVKADEVVGKDDKFWKGENLLGISLMRVREVLKEQEDALCMRMK